jgi:CBS domain containing-hemolysin-like protein
MINNLMFVLIAFGLVALNGFFVAAEFGLVKLRSTRVRAIAKVHGLPGHILAKVHDDLDAYLSACQLGITLASLGLGWIGEPAFAELLEPLLTGIGISSPETIHGVSFFFAFLTISYLHIVLGELVPKSMAIRISEKVAIWTAMPLYGFYWLMYPFIWILNTSANWVMTLVGLGGIKGHDSHYSAEELNAFNRDELGVIAHILDFGNLDVADLMRPFHEAVPLSATQSLNENLDIIARHRFSRYPYLAEDGHVWGIIHLKDLFIAQHQNRLIDRLDEFIRPIKHVSPTTPAIELFRRFRKGAPHFAVVGYKDSPPLGFITLDNMLAALVGNIRDEFLKSKNDWSRLDDGTLTGKGSLPIFTLERALGITIDVDADTDTDTEVIGSVSGLVMWKLGSVPAEGSRIEFDQFDVVIKKMNGPRIMLVRIYPKLDGKTVMNRGDSPLAHP